MMSSKTSFLTPLLALVISASAQAADKPADARPDNTPPPGFVALFNGKDMTGWHGLAVDKGPVVQAKMSRDELAAAQKKADQRMRDHWRVENGMLVFDGKGDSLVSIKDYGNYELQLDWKIDRGGDSGVYVRGTPQIQIWDPDFPDYFRLGSQKGSGGLWNNKKNERWPLVKADKPTGEWNRFRIKMAGEKVTVHLNDILVTNEVVLENYWEPAKPLDPTGTIELQAHLHPLYVKNVYLKELR